MPNFDELDPLSPLTRFSMFLMSLPLGDLAGAETPTGLSARDLGLGVRPSLGPSCGAIGGVGDLEGALVGGGESGLPAGGWGDLEADDNSDEAAEGCFWRGMME